MFNLIKVKYIVTVVKIEYVTSYYQFVFNINDIGLNTCADVDLYTYFYMPI